MRAQWVLGAAVAALSAPSAYAVTYFTTETVQHALFPAATEARAQPQTLTDAQRSQIAAQAAVRVREPNINRYEMRGASGVLGYLYIDEVTGKHEFITYAVALGVDGRVLGLEIMDYRENYGGQVRDARWRAQFTGKGAGDSLALERDIQNISGATLSSVHITDGVRRVLATHAALRQ